MEYILIGILAAVVWGVRQTTMDLYDRVYRIEVSLSQDKVHTGGMKFKPLLDIEDKNESI